MKILRKIVVLAALLLIAAASFGVLDTCGLFDHGVVGRWICYGRKNWELVFYRDRVFSFRGEKGHWEKMDGDQVRMRMERGPEVSEFVLCRYDPETRRSCRGRGHWHWGGRRYRYYKLR